MSQVLDHVYQAIGNTPIVRLSRITEHYGVEGNIFAKLEYLNPGFSKKDRPAREMIEDAKRSGRLKPGQTVVEATSGNTGTGLAIVCRALGHPFVACMSEGNTPERARMMKALGAEVVVVKQEHEGQLGKVSGGDYDLVTRMAIKIAEDRNGFWADQFGLESSTNAHRFHTGPEIWDQTNGEIDAFVDIMGSGGTFVGIAEALKDRNPLIRAYAVEPEAAAVYAGHELIKDGAHVIQGCGYHRDLPSLPQEKIHGLVEEFLQVKDEEVIQMVRDLAKYEGAFVGFSSGANVLAAVKLLKEREKGSNIVLTLNDSGLKYLSTDLFE